jgi:hypothetical protein
LTVAELFGPVSRKQPMIRWMTNTICLLSLIGGFLLVPLRSSISIAEGTDDVSHKFSLLSGGGTKESDNHVSFYKNITYAFTTLKKVGYLDSNIKVLFYGGKQADHPIVEGDATKKNFIYELKRIGKNMSSKDSLLIFRSGHGILKCRGTKPVMIFSDGDLSNLEFEKILTNLKAKQIIIILNQCFSGAFTDIALRLDNTVIITETGDTEMALKQNRKTSQWEHDEWPFVKCLFDGLSQMSEKGEKQSVFNAYHYQLMCNPYVNGITLHPDRPLLKITPKIRYGSRLKKGAVYLY